MRINEEKYVYPHIYSSSNYYWHFIDDIFFIWNGTVVKLQEFVVKLNNRCLKTKFNFKCSKSSIKILDKIMYKKNNKISFQQLFIAVQLIGQTFYTIHLLILSHC